ncbi:uncharacterized protein UHO2_04978 [Ustilago hordei]|uniref:Uncharacterized protein n=1 Tax=Ustilago hordei TaxID=120017 RepID=I2FLX4_USTHO|nr:uncharacterized protein UHO2_04978 [Ustilago hordei]CCF47917.1 uncharacterized protein UHOR_12160 [Ustilago hordei]SYW83061.1 uncharacterized protein UHO2_04978 [Ustilago hordei]
MTLSSPDIQGPPPPALTVPAQAGEDYSPASPPRPNLYEVDAHGPPRELTTPERQALWEAELARTPTPPPMADKVVDSILDAPRQGTPVYRLEVQPLTPPPWWRNCQTPPPPPPDHHLPTNGEIAGWAERFIVANVVAQIAAQHYPLDWDVPHGSIPECCLHCLAMLRLTEGCMPWPSWQCHQCFNLVALLPCSPTHLVSATEFPVLVRTVTSLGWVTVSVIFLPIWPRGSHQAEQAHLTMVGGDGPGLIRLEERTFDPVMTGGWVTTMRVVFHLCRPGLPHESVTESGSPPDPIDEWVAPTEEELVIHSSLAPPPPPSSYVNM